MRATAGVAGLKCPAGCGRSTPDGNWCGLCAWSRVYTTGLNERERLDELRGQPWPFTWNPPARSCGG